MVRPLPGKTIDTSRVVEVLDAASAAAWDCRGKAQAICAARSVLDQAPGEVSTAAYTAWRGAVGYAGSAGWMAYLTARYRNAGDIGLSLTRAAFIVEQREQT